MNAKRIILTAAACVAMVGGMSITAPQASAAGLGVQILRGAGIINKEQGEILDGAHRDLKESFPEYGKLEERVTNDFRSGMGLEPHCEPIYNKWGDEVGCE